MKKTYIIPVTEISSLLIEGGLLAGSMTGTIDGEGNFGGGGGDGNGGSADVKLQNLWEDDEEEDY